MSPGEFKASEMLGRIELLHAAREVLDSPELHPELAQVLSLGDFTPDVHTDVFVIDLKPFASIYLSKVATLGGEVQDLVAGYYRAVGMSVPKDPDSLSQMLAHYEGLLHLAIQGEDAVVLERTTHLRRAFLHEHILTWVPFYLIALKESYRSFALFCDSMVELLCHEAEELNLEVKALIPLVLTNRTYLEIQVEPEERFLDVKALVSPFSSGLILTQKDLLRCARESGTVARMGTKSFMLETLLGQSPEGVLEWLLKEAKTQGLKWDALEGDFGKVAESWTTATRYTQSYLEFFLNSLKG